MIISLIIFILWFCKYLHSIYNKVAQNVAKLIQLPWHTTVTVMIVATTTTTTTTAIRTITTPTEIIIIIIIAATTTTTSTIVITKVSKHFK